MYLVLACRIFAFSVTPYAFSVQRYALRVTRSASKRFLPIYNSEKDFRVADIFGCDTKKVFR
jgi:hypothetical protein